MPTPFETETAKTANAPSYYITIDGITTKEYSTHPIKAAVLPKIVSMDPPEGTQQTLNPLQNKATVGEIRVNFVDTDSEITDLISTDGNAPTLDTLINRKLTLFAGYTNLDEADFTPVFSGEIRQVDLVAPLMYRFTVVELKRRFEELLMSDLDDRLNENERVPLVALSETAFVGQSQIILQSVTAFPPELQGFLSPSVPFVLYTKAGNRRQVVNLNRLETEAKRLTFDEAFNDTYLAGDFLSRGTLVRGNLINLFYSYLVDDFETDAALTSFPLLSSLNSPNGLGLATADIDTASFIKTRDQLLGDYDVEFFHNESVKARTFFEKEIYPLGFFPFVNGAGKIGIRTFAPQGPEVLVPIRLEKEHMVGFPKWRRLFKDHFNRVVVFGDHNPVKSDFEELVTVEDTTDQTATNETGELKIESRGLRSNVRTFDGIELAREIAFRQLRRWLKGPIEVEVELLFTKRLIQIGDVVEVSHPALPDTVAGSRGLVRELYEVIRTTHNFEKGIVKLLLFNQGFQPFAYIGPPTMTDFPSATPSEKDFCYMGDVNNKLDGGTVDGYLIY